MLRYVKIILILSIVGIVVLGTGAVVGSRWDLKEEYYYQSIQGEQRLATRTITIYPFALIGLTLAVIGGSLESVAALSLVLGHYWQRLDISEEECSQEK
jgi:hypothetical protein